MNRIRKEMLLNLILTAMLTAITLMCFQQQKGTYLMGLKRGIVLSIFWVTLILYVSYGDKP